MGTLVACRLDILSMCKLVPSTVQQNGQFEAELCEVSKTPPSDELKKTWRLSKIGSYKHAYYTLWKRRWNLRWFRKGISKESGLFVVGFNRSLLVGSYAKLFLIIGASGLSYRVTQRLQHRHVSSMSRWWNFKYFWNFHPYLPGEMIQFEEHLFKLVEITTYMLIGIPLGTRPKMRI